MQKYNVLINRISPPCLPVFDQVDFFAFILKIILDFYVLSIRKNWIERRGVIAMIGF